LIEFSILKSGDKKMPAMYFDYSALSMTQLIDVLLATLADEFYIQHFMYDFIDLVRTLIAHVYVKWMMGGQTQEELDNTDMQDFILDMWDVLEAEGLLVWTSFY
jgi:hypothetical protein